MQKAVVTRGGSTQLLFGGSLFALAIEQIFVMVEKPKQSSKVRTSPALLEVLIARRTIRD